MLFDVFCPAPVSRHRAARRSSRPWARCWPTPAPDLYLCATTPTSRPSRSEEIQDCSEEEPELEALHRLAMVLHNQYPWDRAQARLIEVGKLDDDDFVVLFTPRTRDIERVPPSRPAR